MFFQKNVVNLHLQSGHCNLNTMSELISHTGTIDSISDGMVRVRIVQSSACASCKVASHCTSAESKEKIVDVRCNDALAYRVGQEVEVMAGTSVGMKAVLLAFVIPTVIVIAVIVGALQMEVSQGFAAIYGLVALIPYYIVLSLFRKKLEKELSFWIKA